MCQRLDGGCDLLFRTGRLGSRVAAEEAVSSRAASAAARRQGADLHPIYSYIRKGDFHHLYCNIMVIFNLYIVIEG